MYRVGTLFWTWTTAPAPAQIVATTHGMLMMQTGYIRRRQQSGRGYRKVAHAIIGLAKTIFGFNLRGQHG